MSGESSPYVDHDGMEDEFQYCFPEAAAAEKAQTQFLRNTSQLFQNPKYSDFTINCDGRAWPVHKAIVCPHSKFFEAVCDGGFRVRNNNEGVPAVTNMQYRKVSKALSRSRKICQM